MIDYVTLGPSPVDEDCVQVGCDDYQSQAKAECRRFKELLKKKFGEPPFGAWFKIKGFPHDFGTYYEVIIEYTDTEEEAEEFAYHCENNLPQTWEDDTPCPMTGGEDGD